MIEINTASSRLLMHISLLIKQEITTGYTPNWRLSFGDFYRSWHLQDGSRFLIANDVLRGFTSGAVEEIIEGKKKRIHWSIIIEKENNEDEE